MKPTRDEWKDVAVDLANWLRLVIPPIPRADVQAALNKFERLIARENTEKP